MPGARALLQRGRVAVGGAGEFVEQAAREAAQALEVRLHVPAQVIGQVEREQAMQLGVGAEQVLAVAVGNGVRGSGSGNALRRGRDGNGVWHGFLSPGSPHC
jgi:hypothetical protein